MNRVVLAACIGVAGCVLANAAENERGMVRIPGEGKVALVDACGVGRGPLEPVARKLGDFLMVDFEIRKSSWSIDGAQMAFDTTGANAAVFVIRDKTMPMSLVALENRWGVVNAEGIDEKDLTKEVLRVTAQVLGCGSSKYPASAMGAVSGKGDLGKVGEALAFDSLMSIMTYLPAIGIKPARMLDREDAIENGLIKADATK